MRSVLITGTIIIPLLATPVTFLAAAAPGSSPGIVVNRGVVELETTGSAGSSVRVAEDLANIIDDGATRRVVPVVGKGSLQNLTDLRLLRGVDIAILQADVFDYARQQKLLPGIENSITYIAKLHNEEFHLLVRQEIKTIEELANQRVNVDLTTSGTAVTASRLFELIRLPVVATNDSQEVALEKLRSGEIAAVAFVAGKPAPLFRGLTSSDGFHLLSIPVNSDVVARYVPARLTATDYPDLVPPEQPVDTVAVGMVLAAADLQQSLERSRNVANFVDAFFTGFPSLLTPGHHPKWHEVNLSSELPGWRRYPPAEQWLQRNAPVANAPDPEHLKYIFARFVDERRQSTGGTPMTQKEKDDLFEQFQHWQGGISR